MSNEVIIKQAIAFVVYILAQVLLAKNLIVFQIGFSFLYIAYLINFPLEVSRSTLLLIAFFTGFIIDWFYDTMGIHASACVFIAFLRPYIIQLLSSSKKNIIKLLIKDTGFIWFLNYTLIIVFLHHSIIFFVELGHFSLVTYTLSKVVASTIFTTLNVIIIQYLFLSSSKNI